MAKLVAATYSEALFDVAVEVDKIDLFMEDLNGVVDSFDEYPEFFELFKTPQISIEEKKDIIENVFSGKINQEVLNFLKIVIDKQRGKEIAAITKAYEARVYKHKGIEKATIVSAVPLSDENMKLITEKLETLTGKIIEMTGKIDKTILGGVTVRIGDRVLDGSLKSRLENVKEDLARLVV
ncbi:MAG: F0F1 ATP synthase subunit delta [Peptostreptococcaceae bacterium]|nr:F0F1 ATP synthase subunit delta [Peptostreptococcaceae bacterium]